MSCAEIHSNKEKRLKSIFKVDSATFIKKLALIKIYYFAKMKDTIFILKK